MVCLGRVTTVTPKSHSDMGSIKVRPSKVKVEPAKGTPKCSWMYARTYSTVCPASTSMFCAEPSGILIEIEMFDTWHRRRVRVRGEDTAELVRWTCATGHMGPERKFGQAYEIKETG